MMGDTSNVSQWSPTEVSNYLNFPALSEFALTGEDLLLLREKDLVDGLLKRWLATGGNYANVQRVLRKVRKLQLENISTISNLGYDPEYIIGGLPLHLSDGQCHGCCNLSNRKCNTPSPPPAHSMQLGRRRTNDGNATRLKPELLKTFISLLYLFVVTWITAFVMVIVHNRVPDMKKYPPLPDIFLDNVPHIPWAFAMCECTATLMLVIWLTVLTFHRHRFILLRRFFALSGTVFLLRCVTMLITSLSVPGSHLQCFPMKEELRHTDNIWAKMNQAYVIWSGVGLSIKGVRTCGDYMFSGHTAALTILNFFITEYTPRHLYFMHTFSWVLNMFGIFFILSGHEHYSIDVFIAFYITSRLFLYYHTLANNQALMQRDSTRTRIWFPLFSYFESEIDGIIPNEFDTPGSLLESLVVVFKKQCAYLYSISMRRSFRHSKRGKIE